MRHILSILLCILSASAVAGPRKPTIPAELAVDARIPAAQKRITDALNDPESARFRDVGLSPKGLAVCGQVNAKNAYGGYVGFKRFIVAADRSGIEGDGSSFVESNWTARCINDVRYD